MSYLVALSDRRAPYGGRREQDITGPVQDLATVLPACAEGVLVIFASQALRNGVVYFGSNRGQPAFPLGPVSSVPAWTCDRPLDTIANVLAEDPRTPVRSIVAECSAADDLGAGGTEEDAGIDDNSGVGVRQSLVSPEQPSWYAW